MQPDLVIALIAVFATVALVSGTLTSLVLSRNAPERRRLRQLTTRSNAEPEKLPLMEAPSPAMKRLSKTLPGSQKERLTLRRKLAAAGYDHLGASVLYSS